MRTIYNAALLPARAASVVFGAWPRASKTAELERDQRLGRRLPEVPPGGVWIHGASVGEAKIVSALGAELSRRKPGRPLLASAVTRTGLAQLPASPVFDASFFLPLDFESAQRRTFDGLKPGLLVLVETELWPNLLSEAALRHVPVVVVNARLAPERMTRYRWLSGLYGPLLREIAAIAVAGPDEVARFTALGVPEPNLRVIGNLKFDIPAPLEGAAAVRERLGLPSSRPVVIAGSTGEGEDALVLDAFAAARAHAPDLCLIVAPRHPTRFASAVDEARRRGFVVARTSEGRIPDDTDVVVADSLGQLAALYAAADVAFVGGSLVRVGGHNLLEPIAVGVPVLFGPHTEHVAEIASALEREGAGLRVADAAALGGEWARLLGDIAARRALADAGRRVMSAHRGAVSRAADLVLDHLGRPGAGGA